MSRANTPEPRPIPADTLETTDGWLERAVISGIEITRDRAGNVLIRIGTQAAILDRDATRRAQHALACAVTPYGEHPREETTP